MRARQPVLRVLSGNAKFRLPLSGTKHLHGSVAMPSTAADDGCRVRRVHWAERALWRL